MCLFTHFAAGALAGALTGNVYAAVAAGLVSHAVLDVIPHYDHPDWRVELGGGVLSLVGLFLLPMWTWPAVVGGLSGMLPDLENLFQKLGKMRRAQFVFPTHTGLLPHGRALGPRSLVWQLAIFVVCFMLLGLVGPATAAGAGDPGNVARMDRPVVRVLDASQDRTVVRIEFPAAVQPGDWETLDTAAVVWALPEIVEDEYAETPRILPPRLSLMLAVPTLRPVQARALDIRWWREPETAVTGDELLQMSVPTIQRAVPTAGTLVPLGLRGGILAGLTVEFVHPASGAPRRQLELASGASVSGRLEREPPRAPSGILNPDLYVALARGGKAALQARAGEKNKAVGLFELTDNWIKLEVTATGVHRLTGLEMLGYGVPTTAVDPGKLRMFRGGGMALDRDPELPDSLQSDRIGLNEIPIAVVDGSDGEWNLDDEVRFYGFGSSAWLDRFEAGADSLAFYDHPYAAAATYWLTWESEGTATPLPGAPLRIQDISAAPTGGETVSAARLRLHQERQVLDEVGLFEDNWAWDNAIDNSRPLQFTTRAPVPGAVTSFVIDVRGNFYLKSSAYFFEASGWLNDDGANRATLSWNKNDQNSTRRITIDGDSQALVAGENTIWIENNAPPSRPLLYLDSFDILYWSGLDLATDPTAQLDFAHWGEQVTGPATPVDLTVAVPAGRVPTLWDVTDPQGVVGLTGTATGPTSVTYGVVRDPDADRHFVAFFAEALLNVAGGRRVDPVDLRQQDTALDYLAIHAPEFAQAAADLAAFHNEQLPGIASPAARAVAVTDIYDNFSGGQKDPFAIRNYLKYVYEQSGMRLAYACFIGKTTRDFRNYKGAQPGVDLYDFLPTDIRTVFPIQPLPLSRTLAYASDDGLVSFDTAPAGGVDDPDLACGRLAARSAAEADYLVSQSIAYQRDPDAGPWRNQVIFAADDCVRFTSYPNPIQSENAHTAQAEALTNFYLPVSLDVNKIYGVTYPFPPSSRVKPAMRTDINNSLGQGATIYYYVGHGAEDNLSDEQIFQTKDIPNLDNGMKRPVFIAFSCDVGVYDSPRRLSMAEEFLLSENGGAIASVCASQVSFSGDNNQISNEFFGALYPERRVSQTVSLAEALRVGKGLLPFTSVKINAQRYNLMGDPALVLPHPPDQLSFAAASVDTLKSGALQAVVLDAGAGQVLAGAGDAYRLRVEESAPDYEYLISIVGTTRTFVQPGATVFVGSGTMGTGDLTVPFKVPVQLKYGDRARVRLILDTPAGDFTAAETISAVRSATGPDNDIDGPRIAMAFEDDRFVVRPGTILTAVLEDTSGIAILGTSPGNSLLLEFDESGFMTDLTGSFAYDANSYTRGRLALPLPGDLSLGTHKAALHGSDALGNVGSDTLSFEVAPAGVAGIDKVTLFPNPTPGPCRLLFELSDPMEVQWEIYTLSGRRLKTVRENFTQAGPRILPWDGLDNQGDEIANGTYLYVLRGLGGGNDGRDLTKTGKLVIMR